VRIFFSKNLISLIFCLDLRFDILDRKVKALRGAEANFSSSIERFMQNEGDYDDAVMEVKILREITDKQQRAIDGLEKRLIRATEIIDILAELANAGTGG